MSNDIMTSKELLGEVFDLCSALATMIFVVSGNKEVFLMKHNELIVLVIEAFAHYNEQIQKMALESFFDD